MKTWGGNRTHKANYRDGALAQDAPSSTLKRITSMKFFSRLFSKKEARPPTASDISEEQVDR